MVRKTTPVAKATHNGTIKYYVNLKDRGRPVKAVRKQRINYYIKDGPKKGEGYTKINASEFYRMWDAGELKKQKYTKELN